jgi:hypothetical protein
MQSINQKLAEKQILFAMDQGVNYFDTAVPYHNGKSEPFLGKVLSQNGYREKVKIATKLPHWRTHSKADMEGFMAKPLIWLIGRTMKVRKKKRPQAVSTKST